MEGPQLNIGRSDVFLSYIYDLCRMEREKYFLAQKLSEVGGIISHKENDMKELEKIKKERAEKEQKLSWFALLFCIPVSLFIASLGGIAIFGILDYLLWKTDYLPWSESECIPLSIGGAILFLIVSLILSYRKFKRNDLSVFDEKESVIEGRWKRYCREHPWFSEYYEIATELKELKKHCNSALSKLYSFNVINPKYREIKFMAWLAMNINNGRFTEWHMLKKAYMTYEEESRRNNFIIEGHDFLPNLLTSKGLEDVKKQKQETLELITFYLKKYGFE